MKKILWVFPFLILFINCPKKYKPDLEKIEVYYIGSIYNDLLKEKPLLAGTVDLPGITIGSCRTEPKFLQVLMGRVGLTDLLSSTGIDYVIGDVDALHFENVSYFVVPDYMGYGIQNIGGIRFAVFYPGKKDLTISDQVDIALVKERSDVLWLINEDEARYGPRRIDFYIQNRAVADTTWSKFSIVPDSSIMGKIATFKQRLAIVLYYKFRMDNKPFNSYFLERMATSEQADVILYPEHFFSNTKKYDSLTVFELLQSIDCGQRFKTIAAFSGKQVDSIIKANNFDSWGKVKKNNNKVLMPDSTGRYLFDIIAPR